MLRKKSPLELNSAILGGACLLQNNASELHFIFTYGSDRPLFGSAAAISLAL